MRDRELDAKDGIITELPEQNFAPLCRKTHPIH